MFDAENEEERTDEVLGRDIDDDDNDTADKDAVATETPLRCSVYDDKKGESYFEQAFIVEKKIGAGYFGELMREMRMNITLHY